MYARRYKDAFTMLGLPLKSQHTLNHSEFQELNVSLPKALHEYYEIAGMENQPRSTFNRLLSPKDLVVSHERLVFMEENQAIVCWGLAVNDLEENPTVEQALNINGELSDWHSEGVSCADFLLANLYWQASFGGGLPYSAISIVDAEFQVKLDNSFSLLSKIGKLSIYGRQNCAIAYLQMGDQWHLYGGFQSHELQSQIGHEISINWQDL